ncbi:hypothetical protein ES703_27562 [subsurface metagenome]
MDEMTYKLGKLPALPDKRNIKLASILRKKLLPELPDTYDIDDALGGIDDNRMFANDEYGNCVIAARAHQTFRFEKYEQGKQIAITDQEVIDQYLKEALGIDMGLILLLSLKRWRKEGWSVGGKNYTIYAFSNVDWKNHEEVRHCIHLLGGVNFGMKVYQSDIDQIEAGEAWHLTDGIGAYLGGHGVYAYKFGKLIGYDERGVTCMTWGKRQRMTWAFWDNRVDEAYGIVDNRDDWLEDSPLDVEKLDQHLFEITGEGEPSFCLIMRFGAALFNLGPRLFRRKSRFFALAPRHRPCQ